MAFVGAHFSKAVAAEGAAAQLAALPADVLQQLLASETLQAASEIEVAQVRPEIRTDPHNSRSATALAENISDMQL